MKCKYNKKCSNEAVPQRRMCREHLNILNVIIKKFYDAKRRAKLCLSCGVVLETNRRKCNSCRKIANSEEKEEREIRKANGICVVCKRHAVAKRVRCKYHLEWSRKYMREYKLRRVSNVR